VRNRTGEWEAKRGPALERFLPTSVKVLKSSKFKPVTQSSSCGELGILTKTQCRFIDRCRT
jgi:hypothetical protein